MSGSNHKMSQSEAGRLGGLASKIYLENLRKENIEKYNLNPSKCKHCNCFLDYERRHNNFCSKSCAASFNNKRKELKPRFCKKCGKEFTPISSNGFYCEDCKRTLNSNKEKSTKIKKKSTKIKKETQLYSFTCLGCGKNMTSKYERLYCDSHCQALHRWEQIKQRIIETGEFDTYKGSITKGETNRRQARRFLEEEYGHKCAICGLSEWMGQPIPLVVDHIDGDPLNHKIDNFRLVCGNCDMQLPTYKAKNRGKGRKYRRDLYEMDKISQ